MRLTILGGDGGWPRPGGACSGYLVEHEGYSVLLDPGPGTFPRLTTLLPAAALDAVLVSHGHPDHVLDLNPLLRARAFADPGPPPLPVHAPEAALAPVLALDRAGVLDQAVYVRELLPGREVTLGPVTVRAAELPHTWLNLGLRISAAGATLVYTGDSGPSPALHELARNADVLLAEASHVDEVPPAMAGLLSTAGQRGDDAREAGVGRLVLTHLLPGEDASEARDRAAARFAGPVDVARPGLVVEVGAGRPQ
ncbi:MBL fold metallo-hydrolase [Nocardioides sp.]|uniref:MBL fold metallo-hydrolase n=1 Tax=Nocardioides sp. TaxID=35761 RepID=UPI002ED63583